MGKIAFVFSGQGAQRPGMGSDLGAVSESAAKVFAELDTLRPGTSEMCFNGTAEELMQTANTQPCLYAVETAAAAAMREAGIEPDMTAGFSLGEIAALACSGAVSREAGFRIVCERGRIMQNASEKYPASMAAVLKLPNEEVERICSELEQAYPVNYNCSGQVTCAAAAETMPRLIQSVKDAGGRAVPLKVSGGFHSPFMQGASEEFAVFLRDFEISQPGIPLYSNFTAEPYTDNPTYLLSQQICSPVKWEKLVNNMIAAGCDTFVELGAGNTLQGLIQRIDKSVRAFAVNDAASLEKAAEALR